MGGTSNYSSLGSLRCAQGGALHNLMGYFKKDYFQRLMEN